MEADLQEINRKLDALTRQMGELSSQMQALMVTRQAAEDLLEAGMPVARQALDGVGREMEDIQDDLDGARALRLMKKLVRRLPQIETLADQLESITDLLDVVQPILRQALDLAVFKADELERKGAFRYAESGLKLADKISAACPPEEMDKLADSIIPLLELLRDAGRPETIRLMQRMLGEVEEEMRQPVSSSLMGLSAGLRDAEVRRGLALLLRVVKVIGHEARPK